LLVAALILAFLAFRAVKLARPLPSPAALPVVIDVEGDVRHPDRYALPGPTATIEDAIRAAGGLTDRAAPSIPEDVLDRPVASGTAVHARRVANGGYEFRVEPLPAAMRLVLGIKLDVNEASLDDLVCVPRMTPDTARAIVRIRAERPWRNLGELTTIPGVGPKSVEKWESFLCVRPDHP
jgi:DNA uptake protein ComE-like DNA-binding protein